MINCIWLRNLYVKRIVKTSSDGFIFILVFFLCIGHRPWCVNGKMIRDATFNAEDGFVKFYLRGRPVIVYAPSPLLDSYNLSKINMAPQARLKMEWVYPFLAMLYTYTLSTPPFTHSGFRHLPNCHPPFFNQILEISPCTFL